MTQQTQKVEPAAAEAEALRAKLIVRLDNDPLLKLADSVRELSKNLESSYWHNVPKTLKEERDTLFKEVKAFLDALDHEYKQRVLRAHRHQFQKLLAALQPPVPEAQGRRLIPLNAAAAAERDGESSLQEETPELVLLEQLRSLLLGAVPTAHADVPEEDTTTKS